MTFAYNKQDEELLGLTKEPGIATLEITRSELLAELYFFNTPCCNIEKIHNIKRA